MYRTIGDLRLQVGIHRMKIITDLIGECVKYDGVGVEIGVYRGGSLSIIAECYFKSNKCVYGIDTFEGLPNPCKLDLHKKGDFSDVSFNDVEEYFSRKYPNVRLIKGIFPSDHVIREISHNRFNFVHVDVDLYKSTLDCLKFFVPQLVPGGALIIDDYGWWKTKGAKVAVDEYVSRLSSLQFEFRKLETVQYLIRRKDV